MGFSLVTAATEYPITVQDVVDQCQLGDIPSDQRGRVTGMIAGAVEVLQRRMRRQFCTATWKRYLDYFPDEIQIDDRLPVASITHVKYTNALGVLTTLTPAATYYQTDLTSTQKPARIMPAYGTTWPSTQTGVYNAVEVQFVAGYGGAAAVPACIKDALLMIVSAMYRDRGDEITEIPTALRGWVDVCIAAEDWGAYS